MAKDQKKTKDQTKTSRDVATERDLKRLKRNELLEIMLAQSKEIDRLRAALREKEQQLADRTIRIREAGSIAEASLQLTRVFEEAQRAADLYLENVRRRASQPSAGMQEREETQDAALQSEADPHHSDSSSKQESQNHQQ